MLLWLLFWFVPTSVRSQIGRTIEDFVALGAPIFHVDNHRASAIERKEKVIILLLQKPLLLYNMCAVCYTLLLLDRILRMTCYSKSFIYIEYKFLNNWHFTIPRKHDIRPFIDKDGSPLRPPSKFSWWWNFTILHKNVLYPCLYWCFLYIIKWVCFHKKVVSIIARQVLFPHFAKPPDFFCIFLYFTTTSSKTTVQNTYSTIVSKF